MNAKYLSLKFTFVAGLVGLCIWWLYTYKLREGIDLRGGHSLIFEIRTNESEINRLTKDKAELEAKLSAATSDAEKQSIKETISRVNSELNRYKSEAGDSGNLADRMITTLKNRVDPQGLRSLEWRPLGNNRIEIRMPAGSTESTKAKNEYIAALEELEQKNIHRNELRRLFQADPEKRTAEIDALAGQDAALKDKLADLIKAYDAMEAAGKALAAAKGDAAKAKVQDAYDNAIIEYENRMQSVEAANINPQQLQAILANYIPESEAEAIGNKAEVKALLERFNREMSDLPEKFPARAAELNKVKDKYITWANGRQRLDDPADLKRLIAKAGVLEFRIAPYAPGQGKFSIPPAEVQRYVEELAKEGPDGGRKRNEPLLWFPIREEREKYSRLITADYAGKSYVLLYNQAGNEMLHQAGAGGWSLSSSYPTTDQNGRPAVGFEFDAAGAKRFAELTSNHVGNVLAVLLDDEVYSAPVIQAIISSRGIIEGNFTRDEVRDLVRTLEAGSLPARLNPDPVAESSFGPGIGAENLRTAIRAGYWSCFVIVVFMLVIYFFCGIIANVALCLNILFIMGTMSLLSAVFTLPGIAGVILSIGMAVDANVLIFERLREEQAKGQSIRMAVKNAYERAFSAIIDSNVTTLITCVILGWVGTEEVRGFAITLGLGVVFNIFTAVTVTRWIFQALMESRIVTKPLKMVRLIGVPKVDWMAKRYYFWAFSIATGILGIASLYWQGKNIWGIEFSAGTQAVIMFKDDALIKGQLPNDGLVRELFRSAAEKDKAEKLTATSIVETVLDSSAVDNFLKAYDAGKDGKVSEQEWIAAGKNKEYFEELLAKARAEGNLTREQLQKVLPARSYQISTTETSVPLIKKVATEAFGTALEQRIRHTFNMVVGKTATALGVPLVSDGRTRIDAQLIQKANPSFRDELSEYEDGVLLVFDDIQPPIQRSELLQRIRDMRFQPDLAGTGSQFNRTDVLGITRQGDGFSAAAVLVSPADQRSVEDPAAWAAFADGEINLVKEALNREEAMVAKNFYPAIAAETSQLAIVAVVLSWAAIIAYLWIRFGSARWGLAAVICLIHDSIIVVGLVAVSGWLSKTAIGQALGVESFKIDLAMVAAVLTLIGYSVNDTIVVFDRIRENRGKLTTVNAAVINNSINQTLSRTILTSSTVFIVVLIMYIWAGPGIKGFNYAFLFGVMFGTYSSVAVAAPLLMGFKAAMLGEGAKSAAQ